VLGHAYTRISCIAIGGLPVLFYCSDLTASLHSPPPLSLFSHRFTRGRLLSLKGSPMAKARTLMIKQTCGFLCYYGSPPFTGFCLVYLPPLDPFRVDMYQVSEVFQFCCVVLCLLELTGHSEHFPSKVFHKSSFLLPAERFRDRELVLGIR